MKTAVHWIARVSAAVSVIVLSLLVIGNILEMDKWPSVNESVGLLFFPFGLLLGLLTGFKQPMYGGCVAIVSLLAFYSWHMAVEGNLPRGLYFVIFALPGLLFLTSGWLSKRRQEVAL